MAVRRRMPTAFSSLGARIAWATVGSGVLAMVSPPAQAQATGGPALPPVTVSASRDPVMGAAGDSSAPTNHVTVIDEQALRRAPATSLAEVLATEANLNLHSYYGNDRHANVDMRGMGETAISNVLVVVDGEVLNEHDLSAADLSTVPLSQIARIEVIRGGGSVLYGPGAVGGVISITTRRPEPGRTHAEAGLRLGSFGARATRAAVEGGFGQFAARLQANHATTDGYRDNSGLRTEQLGGELRWLPRMGLSEIYLRASQSRSRHGFPGPLPASVLEGPSSERRATRTPFDFGTVDDWKVGAGAVLDLKRAGRLTLTYAHRDRQNPYLMGFAPLDNGMPLAQQKLEKTNRIHARREDISARYEIEGRWRGLSQVLTVGGDWGRARYVHDRAIAPMPVEMKPLGRLRSRSGLVDLRLRPVDGVQVHAGVRMDQKSVLQQEWLLNEGCVYAPTPPFALIGCSPRYDLNAQTVRRWNHRSAELGASWRLSASWETFGSLSRHVRQPNIDELTLASMDLRPQRGLTREVGVRFTPSPAFSATLTAFVMNITDEIYLGYDASYLQDRNRNHDWPTRRRGLELDTRWRVLPTLTLRGQWAHVEPRFEVIDTRVPLVPGDTVSASVQWQPAPAWQWTTTARHVSKRMDGNDWSNTAPSLAPYTVVDTALRYERGPFELSAGITNLFDEVYTTKAFSQTVYPMPGRAGYLSLNWRH